MSSEKKQSKVKKQESIGGLLAKIERIEKKLDLLNIIGKSMPAILLSTSAILTALVYISSVATIPEGITTLPQTGDEVSETSDLVMLYPEDYSSIILPDKVTGLSINGFYDDLTTVTFFAQKTGENRIEIGQGAKGSEDGEYTTTWTSAASGRYTLWAEITKSDGTKVKTASITVDIK